MQLKIKFYILFGSSIFTPIMLGLTSIPQLEECIVALILSHQKISNNLESSRLLIVIWIQPWLSRYV